MIILGIDTSCDDTCIAIIRADSSNIEILSNIVSSQVRIHRKYGGVYPTLAKREHQKNLPLVLEKALKKASNIQLSDIDAIAVTIGPGLDPCLWVGINFAKDLAKTTGAPIIPVNHIEAHILANFISSRFQITSTKSQLSPKLQAPNPKQIQNQSTNFCARSSPQQVGCSDSRFKIQNYKNIFPAVALVVSGGHTQLILVKKNPKSNFKYRILGETRDDAAGECLDKTARLLGLGYPGGPAIAAEAEKFKTRAQIFVLGRAHNKLGALIQNQSTNFCARSSPQQVGCSDSRFKIHLPRPMINQRNYDFSFSGLKTAVLYDFKNRPSRIRKSKRYIQAISAEIQQSIIDVLIKKTIRAAKDYRVKSIMLGGGVAANLELRQQFKAKIDSLSRSIKFNFFVPPEKFCTDNAVMVALAGFFHRQRRTKNLKNILARPNLRIS